MLSNLWYAHYAYDFANVLYVIESMVALTNASCSDLSPSELILVVCCCFSNTQVQCIIPKLNALPHPFLPPPPQNNNNNNNNKKQTKNDKKKIPLKPAGLIVNFFPLIEEIIAQHIS